MWSLDGGTAGTISYDDSNIWTMDTHDIASSTILSLITLQSADCPHLWVHNTSFQVMTTEWDGQGHTVNIFEVGSVLTKLESFQINLQAIAHLVRSSHQNPPYKIKSLSPITYHISVGIGDCFAILDIQSSECLLEQGGKLS